jgi:hypothetical protein
VSCVEGSDHGEAQHVQLSTDGAPWSRTQKKRLFVVNVKSGRDVALNVACVTHSSVERSQWEDVTLKNVTVLAGKRVQPQLTAGAVAVVKFETGGHLHETCHCMVFG